MPRDLVSGLFWLAIAIFAAVQGVALKLGSLQRPGPGFFPFWGGVLLALLALILLVKSFQVGGSERRIGRPKGATPPTGDPRRLLVVAGALLGYIGLLETLGFVIVTFVFLLLLLRLERRGWVFSAVAAVAGASSSYALFQLWLRTQLPRGPFGF